MTYMIIGLFCISFHPLKVQAQHIEVFVVDSTGSALNPFSLKLKRTNNTILYYKYFSDTNRVLLKIDESYPDTVLMLIESPAFNSFEQKIELTKSENLSITATLFPKNTTLPNAVVTAPPVWRRGDTTSYRVDAFKTGEEKKLKDIIAKLPDFSFDKSGNLLFKTQPVEKILIDGEEIFADKTELLLSSFPVHVLDQIQALENQNNQKLLKGFTADNKVFVNLKLNDKKLQAAFGDFSATAGLPGKYQFSPTLFALKNKVKVGFVSNLNNLGEGFGPKARREMKTEKETKTELWLMHDLSMEFIDNFDTKNYIENQLMDNRLQINIPINNKMNIKQELSFIKDKQAQDTWQSTDFISGTDNFIRTDTNAYLNKPELWISSTRVQINPAFNREINLSVILAGEQTQTLQKTKYLIENEDLQNFTQNIEKNYFQSRANAEYIYRKTESKAFSFFMNAGQLDFKQQGFAHADNLYQFYNLQDTSLDVQNSSPSIAQKSVEGGLNYFVKKGTKTYQYKITSGLNQFKYLSTVSLTNHKEQPVEVFDLIKNENIQTTSYLHVQTGRVYNIKNTLLSLSGLAGFQSLTNDNRSLEKSRNIKPTFNANLTSRTRVTEKITTSIRVDYIQEFEQPHKIFDGILVTGLSRYENFQNFSNLQRKQINFLSNIMLRSPKGHNHYFAIASNLELNGVAKFNAWNGFINIAIDSINAKAAKGYNLMYNHNYNQFRRNLHISTSVSLGSMQQQFIIDNTITNGNFEYAGISTQVNKSWKKRIFGHLSGNFTSMSNKLPSVINPIASPTIHNLIFKARGSYQFKSAWNISGSGTYFLNNLGNENFTRFNFFDIEGQWKPKDKKYHFSALIRNLTNTTAFESSDLSQFSNSFRSIPFINRSIFFSFYYAL